MNIYVGNIPYAATETDLEKLFGEHGPVTSTSIIRDYRTSDSKGFGFVEMENQEDGEQAIEALDGYEFMGHRLKVNIARDREARAPSSEHRHLQQDARSKRTPSQKSKISTGETFHNPYTFVPSPPRPLKHTFAGDFDPLKCGLDHASLNPKWWTGHIPIKLTTVTPLVLLKTEGKDHPPDKPYDVLDRIPESSLRGMLRSTYEVVTNSRYACFSNSNRLAYRMRPQQALKLIPAIIENGSSPEKLMARLYTGTSRPTADGPKKDGSDQERAMYAAMLTLYGTKELRSECDSGYTPKTDHEVWAQIVLCKHNKPFYLYWKVIKVWPTDKYSQEPAQVATPESGKWKSLYTNRKKPFVRVVKGRVLITNENMGNKHDERIFFVEGVNAKNPIKRDVTDLQGAWRMRIQSYQDAHRKEEILQRRDRRGNPVKAWEKFGNNTGDTAWSPHQYQSDADELKPGDMVYARCEIDDSNGEIKKIEDLFPVMISRELYEKSPVSLLGSSLEPASTISELSPADRLFGWVPSQKQDQRQSSEGGYKSRIRVVCEDNVRSDTTESFSGGALPLAILGQPKPAQGRFYVAKNKKGIPQDKDTSKEAAGYSGNKGLRGRKQYWHHKGLEANKAKAYWQPSAEDRTQEKHDDRYQEYRRPNEDGKKNGKPKTDSQNRFINEWIKPDTVFKASLYVQNLQPEELGALLWLLTLNDEIDDGDEKHYFRLGYGKPLGFGSVKMEIDEERLVDSCLPLGTGEDWKQKYYSALDASPPAMLDEDKQSVCLQAFRASMVAAYKPLPDNDATDDDGDENEVVSNLTSFDQLERVQSRFLDTPENRAQLEEQHFVELPFISGFRRVLRGPKKDAPIHYPRLDRNPNPDGQNFLWFVDNDHYRGGKELALPEVTVEEGLPYKPKT